MKHKKLVKKYDVWFIKGIETCFIIYYESIFSSYSSWSQDQLPGVKKAVFNNGCSSDLEND